MTRALEEEIRLRARGAPTRTVRGEVAREGMSEHLFRAIDEVLESLHRIRFPSTQFQDDPVRFADLILGVRLWRRQIEILRAVRDHDRVAVRSGRKIGKSMIAAILALWYYASWPLARSILTSTTAKQVDEVLWRQLLITRAGAGRCLACKVADPEGIRIPRPCPHSAIIEGDVGLLARTGLKSPDFREVVGFTARESEGLAGISGPNQLYILDEGSGIPDPIYEAVEGNSAAGARIVVLGNPTRLSGRFFEAFHERRQFWHGIAVSSEEVPNVTGLEAPIEGLASAPWIARQKEEYGEASPFYTIHVRGDFPLAEEGRIFSTAAIVEACSENRRDDLIERGMNRGRLQLGVDPSGATGMGDEAGFAARRSMVSLALERKLGLSLEAHIAHIFGMIEALRDHPREVAWVAVDREGAIGAQLYGRLVGMRNDPNHRGPRFEVIAVRASDRAIRQPQVYDRVRDELAANLEARIREGASLLDDAKLRGELREMEWRTNVAGRVKLIAKDDLRKVLGRSPDSFDAVALSFWEPLGMRLDDDDGVDDPPRHGRAVRRLAEGEDDEGGLDPYAGLDEERGRGRR